PDHEHFIPVALDPGSGRKCATASALLKPMTVTSGECLHLYQEITSLSAAHEGSNDFQGSCNQKCVVALVGLQMMVRARTGADWIWISMWWTGKDSHKLKNAPWKYYTIDVTDQPRSALRRDKKPNIIFNP